MRISNVCSAVFLKERVQGVGVRGGCEEKRCDELLARDCAVSVLIDHAGEAVDSLAQRNGYIDPEVAFSLVAKSSVKVESESSGHVRS
jgi:hypothetical protein